MVYTTAQGLRIEVGRVARERLDALVTPPPAPPLRTVTIWGGLTEQLPDTNAPEYQRQLYAHKLRQWRATVSAIAPALEFALPTPTDLAALQVLGLPAANPHTAYLLYHVAATDLHALIGAVYYQSTVTVQGITEAATRFGYTWRGKPLLDWAVGYAHGQRGALANDYRAAWRSRLTWAQFCALPGPAQSEIVAFWLLEDRLAWLMERH